ncbi:MAG TPA: class I SAM-dependent methyltransferase [Planctomycetota bacterium]|nr:class I SAM-dependent methyltransferase [Planctomycetota bacterium]
MDSERSLVEWAAQLRADWTARAALSSRDLFVASHPGWNDEAAWEKHAATEVELFLAGLDLAWLRTVDVLEIGCGSGRLVRLLRAAARSYTGFDIAPGMLEAAHRRAAGLAGVRFFLGEGLGVPAAARDRSYGLVLACAVFIHCPRPVIAANVASAWSVVQPGGQVRLSVLAFPDDPEGIVGPQDAVERAAAVLADDMRAVIESLTPEERRLAFDTYYMGDRFRYADLAPFLRNLTGGEVALYRGDPGAIYAAVTKAR